MKARARRAFLHLGGDPARSTASLRDYDSNLYGPFLGVSDEGSAGPAIRDAAYASPKATALGPARCAPLTLGVAIDAERLGGVGEVAVSLSHEGDYATAVVVTRTAGKRPA